MNRQRPCFLLAYALLLTVALLAGRRGPEPGTLVYNAYVPPGADFPVDAAKERDGWRADLAYLKAEGLRLTATSRVHWRQRRDGSRLVYFSFMEMDQHRSQIESWLTHKLGRDNWCPNWHSYRIMTDFQKRNQTFVYLGICEFQSLRANVDDTDHPTCRTTTIHYGEGDTLSGADAPSIEWSWLFLSTNRATYEGPAWIALAILAAIPVLTVYAFARLLWPRRWRLAAESPPPRSDR